MRRFVLICFLLIPLTFFGAIMNKNGIVTKQSEKDVQTTVQNFLDNAAKNDIQGFTIINHKQNANNRGFARAKDAILIIFDELNVCLDLIQYDPAVGLDLPLKILVYEDEDEKVYIKYRDPKFLKNIYNIGNAKEAQKMSHLLDRLTNSSIK